MLPLAREGEMVREWSYNTPGMLNRRCDEVWSPETMKTAMALRWRGTDDEQLTMATASEHGRKGKRDRRNRKLTLDAWVCSATTGRAGDGGNRRLYPVGVAAALMQ